MTHRSAPRGPGRGRKRRSPLAMSGVDRWRAARRSAAQRREELGGAHEVVGGEALGELGVDAREHGVGVGGARAGRPQAREVAGGAQAPGQRAEVVGQRDRLDEERLGGRRLALGGEERRVDPQELGPTPQLVLGLRAIERGADRALPPGRRVLHATGWSARTESPLRFLAIVSNRCGESESPASDFVAQRDRLCGRRLWTRRARRAASRARRA